MTNTSERRVDIRVDDLGGAPTQSLIAAHLAGMRDTSPEGSVHALDIDALRAPGVTFWSAWADGSVVGIGALKSLDATNGELKSMRVADDARGTGVGRAILRHIVAAARERGIRVLWLETGSSTEFAPARGLYASEGFTECGPFADYRDDPFSVFMTREL